MMSASNLFKSLLLILLFQTGLSRAAGMLDIYVVRHAETLANVSGVHDSHSDNTLSERGQAQVDALTRDLANHHFDSVLVSPAERALLTIQPYLQRSGSVATLWPELTECCWQQERGEDGSLQTAQAIHVPAGIAAQFTFRDGDSTFAYANRNYADGVAQVRQAVSMLKQRYFNSGKRILIVTHYHAGAVLMGELLGVSRDRLPGLKNARVSHLRQLPDGRFELLTINGQMTSDTHDPGDQDPRP
jgi:broad specificity phosphatase PhoE